jgi:hypothetical protein
MSPFVSQSSSAMQQIRPLLGDLQTHSGRRSHSREKNQSSAARGVAAQHFPRTLPKASSYVGFDEVTSVTCRVHVCKPGSTG